MLQDTIVPPNIKQQKYKGKISLKSWQISGKWLKQATADELGNSSKSLINKMKKKKSV